MIKMSKDTKLSVKITSIFVATTLTVTTFSSLMLTGCENTTGDVITDAGTTDAQEREMAEFAGDSEESRELMSVMNSMSGSGSSMATKQETVYVKTSACGKVNEVVVSNWLKNTEGTKELVDTSDLTDIVNVKGHENYTTSDGIEVIWDADGRDIYYQGTTDKNLPVDITISYELDGTPIEPEQLAGKSGHVKIVLNYVNQSANEIEIGGQMETIYTPFAVISGMMLDGEKFTNVTTTNGTVVSDGKNEVVVGMAFPGFVDSLNGSKVNDNELLNKLEDKINIPSEVIIEADTQEFELGMTLTMISSDAISALGLGDIDTSDDTAGLKEDLDEFEDAGAKLVEGTGKLKDGVKELSDGTADMVEGTNDLYSGVKDYTDGVHSAKDGAIKLRDGSVDLDNGMTELKNGINDLDGGAGELADGAQKVSAGVDTLVAKVGGISGNIGTAASAAAQVSGGINQLAEMTSQEITVDQPEIQAISVTGAVSADTVRGAIDANLGEMLKTQAGLSDEQLAAVEQAMSQLVPEMIDKAATQAARQAAAGAADSTRAKINAGITTAQPGASASLKDGAATLAKGLADSAGGADPAAAAEQAKQLKELTDGAKALASGAKTLKSGTGKLVEGASKIKNGTCSLKDGTVALVDGLTELDEHNGELCDGTKELADGSVDLVDGIAKLLDGSIELNDGMIKFDEEGIQKITDLFGTDYDTMSERIKAINDAGKSYKTFTGTSEDEDSSVRFILESEGITL